MHSLDWRVLDTVNSPIVGRVLMIQDGRQRTERKFCHVLAGWLLTEINELGPLRNCIIVQIFEAAFEP